MLTRHAIVTGGGAPGKAGGPAPGRAVPGERGMASERTRSDVWQELFDVAGLVRYYEALADRHKRRRDRVRFLLLAAAATGVAALLDLLPETARVAAGGAIAALVVWDFVADHARKAAVLHAASLECGALEIEWRELWTDVNDANASECEARRRNRQLARRIATVKGWANIPEDRKLNEECARAAHEYLADRYAL